MEIPTVSMKRLWRALRVVGWTGVIAILVAPAVAMQFTTEVNWEWSDFLFASTLLIGGGGVIEFFARKIREPFARVCFALVVVCIVVAIWGASID